MNVFFSYFSKDLVLERGGLQPTECPSLSKHAGESTVAFRLIDLLHRKLTAIVWQIFVLSDLYPRFLLSPEPNRFTFFIVCAKYSVQYVIICVSFVPLTSHSK